MSYFWNGWYSWKIWANADYARVCFKTRFLLQGKVLKRTSPKNKPLVVLGKDTRLSGYILESAFAAGLNTAGVYVHLLGPLPTPAIAHLTACLTCTCRD